jgi:tRNA U54 and U55 pseudouridine synthase Pus10
MIMICGVCFAAWWKGLKNNNRQLGRMMKFIFVCSQRNETFESAYFTILGNKGVVTDKDGNRMLDAKVVLTKPCPICGETHDYHASELVCPFEGSET